MECFEKRNDKRIFNLVCDSATIPTIFEYIIAIIWYRISGGKGSILDYMNLSLDANLFPKTHASGGSCDILYSYNETPNYPKHDLLLEATLCDKANQRRQEMEPVSRHLGEHLIKNNNLFDYAIFISTYLDPNVVNDFRYRKIIPYTKDNKIIKGMKIIPIDTSVLKQIIKNRINYHKLYLIFDKFYQMDLDNNNWYIEMIYELFNKKN